MEYQDTGKKLRWIEANQRPSLRIKIVLELHKSSDSWLGLSPFCLIQDCHQIMKTGGMDTGAKMEICGATLPVRLGIDISSLFPIKAKGITGRQH